MIQLFQSRLICVYIPDLKVDPSLHDETTTFSILVRHFGHPCEEWSDTSPRPFSSAASIYQQMTHKLYFIAFDFFCEHYKPLNRLSFASCSVINVIRYYTDCKNYNLAGFICFSPSHTLFGHNALSFDIYLYAVILQHYILYLHSSHIRG